MRGNKVNHIQVVVVDRALVDLCSKPPPRTLPGVLAMFQGWLDEIPEEYRETSYCTFTTETGHYEGDDPTASVAVYYSRPETDGERLERERQAETDAQNSRLRDLRTLAEVKKRLGLE